jgi:hypothetical protein
MSLSSLYLVPYQAYKETMNEKNKVVNVRFNFWTDFRGANLLSACAILIEMQ